MPLLNRITHNPAVMGGKPCIRGMHVTVGVIAGLVAAGHTSAEIVQEYPYLEKEDVAAALEYAAEQPDEIAAADDEQLLQESLATVPGAYIVHLQS